MKALSLLSAMGASICLVLGTTGISFILPLLIPKFKCQVPPEDRKLMGIWVGVSPILILVAVGLVQLTDWLILQ